MKIVKKLRNYSGLTLKQIASFLSIDFHTVSRYEIGIVKPSFINILKLAELFNFSVDFLISDGCSNYPGNLRLFSLAEHFDFAEMRDQRSQIESVISTFITKVKQENIIILTDDLEDNFTADICENIKRLRLSRNLSQLDVAKATNISVNTISGYERNRYPSITKLKAIADYFKTSCHYLCTGTSLYFNLRDKDFQDMILKADHYLSLEEHKMLIHLMETLLQNAGIDPQNPQHILSKT